MSILILSLLALAPSVYLPSFIIIVNYFHMFALASFLSLFTNRVELFYRIRCLLYLSFPWCVYVFISIFIYFKIFFSSGMVENETNDAINDFVDPDSLSEINW